MSGTTPEALPGNAGRDDYPRMLYHSDGRTAQADSPEADDALLRQGWSHVPQAAHLKPHASPSLVLGSADPLATMIRNVLEKVLDERGIGHAPGRQEPAPEIPFRHRGETRHGR